MVSHDMLAAAMLHEMRQPLTGLKAGLQFLERQLGHVLSEAEDWDFVLCQVARLEEMFATFQDLLQPQRPQPVPFEIGAVATRTVKLMKHRLAPLGRRFTVDISADMPAALGTANALAHALMNVLRNAADALDNAGATARLALRAVYASNAPCPVQVRISDEGPGIPPENRSCVFEARFSTKSPQRGTGVGLFVSKCMIEASGGLLHLADDEDPLRMPWAHTEFCIAFPEAREEK